jgi:hypothetical protein
MVAPFEVGIAGVVLSFDIALSFDVDTVVEVASFVVEVVSFVVEVVSFVFEVVSLVVVSYKLDLDYLVLAEF